MGGGASKGSDVSKMGPNPPRNDQTKKSIRGPDMHSKKQSIRRPDLFQSSMNADVGDIIGNESSKRSSDDVMLQQTSKQLVPRRTPREPRQSKMNNDGDDDDAPTAAQVLFPMQSLVEGQAVLSTQSKSKTATPKDDSKAHKKEESAPKTHAEMKKEADAILKTQLKLYEQTKALRSNPKSLTTEVLKEHVKAVKKSYSSFNEFPYSLKYSFRGKLFSPFIDSGTMALICDTLVDGLEKNAYLVTQGADQDQKDGADKNKETAKDKTNGADKTTQDAEKDKTSGADKITQDAEKDKTHGTDKTKVDKDMADLLADCLQVLCSFTDTSPKVRQGVVKYKGFLASLLNKLDQWCQPHLQGTALAIEDKYVHKSLTIVFMVTAEEEESHIESIRELSGFFEILKHYLSSKKDDNRLTCIAALANVVTEKEAETIAAESDIAKFLIKQLNEAITSESRSSSTGWTIVGLAKVVKNLARNDANKQLLVKEGAVPLLTTGLKPEYQKSDQNMERKRCLESLWWLSFDAKNREEMVKNEELMDFVVDIYKRGPQKDKFSHYSEAEGFLFQMRNTLKENNKYKDIADKLVVAKVEDPVSKTSGHVMMSYQSQYRPVVKATCEFLKKKGFSMWMDIYDMAEGEESTLQTMAEAVEGSTVVIVCFSDTYKNSPFCRAEAEYAFMRGKTILPLKLEKGYSPDGWLGIILGSKFFYDFTKEGKELQDKRQKLLEAVQKAYTLEADSVDGKQLTATSQHGAAAATPRSTMNFEDKVKTWTKKDVEAWRTKFNLKGKEIEALSAEDIIYLYNLKSEAPEAFHASLSSDLALTGISTKASFNRAMDQLPDVADDITQ